MDKITKDLRKAGIYCIENTINKKGVYRKF